MSKQFQIDAVEWQVSAGLTDYAEALQFMEARAIAIAEGKASELIWLVEHPPTYTAGTSADADELLDPRFPVYKAGRGGRYTYHGPGQRVVYVMLNLAARGRDVRAFVDQLEGWMIGALGALGIQARREAGRIGIWVGQGAQEAKIGALGIRIKRWVSYHGISINVTTDLAHFEGIVPCGLAEFSVTSIEKLGLPAKFAELDTALSDGFPTFLKKFSEAAKNA